MQFEKMKFKFHNRGMGAYMLHDRLSRSKVQLQNGAFNTIDRSPVVYADNRPNDYVDSIHSNTLVNPTSLNKKDSVGKSFELLEQDTHAQTTLENESLSNDVSTIKEKPRGKTLQLIQSIEERPIMKTGKTYSMTRTLNKGCPRLIKMVDAHVTLKQS